MCFVGFCDYRQQWAIISFSFWGEFIDGRVIGYRENRKAAESELTKITIMGLSRGPKNQRGCSRRYYLSIRSSLKETDGSNTIIL